MSEYASGHGIVQIYRSRSRVIKIVWFLLVLTATIYALHQVITLFALYLTYPTGVRQEIHNRNSLEFPSVTICRKQPILLSKLENYSADFREIASKLPISRAKKLLYIAHTLANSTIADAPKRFARNVDVPGPLPPVPDLQNPIIIPPNSKDGENAPSAPDNPPALGLQQTLSDILQRYSGLSSSFSSSNLFFDNIQPIKSTLDLLNIDTFNASETQLCDVAENFILSCTFNGEQCNISSDFDHSIHPKYCNCYTFNTVHKSEGKKIRETKLSGSHSGLKLQLFFNPLETDPLNGETVGADIYINNPKSYPYLTDVQKSVQAGYRTDIKLIKKQEYLSPPPISECTTKLENLLFTGIYTNEGCLTERIVLDLISRCSCVLNEMRYEEIHLSYPHVPACNTTPESLSCLTSVLNDESIHTCPIPCSRHIYIPTTDEIKWPADSYKWLYMEHVINITKNRGLTDLNKQINFIVNQTKTLASEIPLIFREFVEQMISETFFKRTFLALNVYYANLKEETIRIERTYELESFLGDIGGQMGFWIGFSVLTVIEVIQLIIQLSVSVFSNRINICPKQSKRTSATHYNQQLDMMTKLKVNPYA